MSSRYKVKVFGGLTIRMITELYESKSQRGIPKILCDCRRHRQGSKRMNGIVLMGLSEGDV